MLCETASKILERIEEWKRRNGKLPDLVALYEELLRIQTRAKSHVGAPKVTLPKRAITDRLNRGIPLLSFESLLVDWSLAQYVLQEIVGVMDRYSVATAKEMEAVRHIASSQLLFKRVARAWYEGSLGRDCSTEGGVEDAFLAVVVQAALQPFLTAHSEALSPLVNQDSWRRRYCAICGGKPDFAFLDKERGARWLMCFRCDAPWLFQRLQCPYCGTEEQNALAYFTDDDELYRLYVCDNCRSYLKAIDLRRAKSEILLPLERVLTFELDRQARGAGYTPGWMAPK